MEKKNPQGGTVNDTIFIEITSRVQGSLPWAVQTGMVGLELPAKAEGEFYLVDRKVFCGAFEKKEPVIYRSLLAHAPNFNKLDRPIKIPMFAAEIITINAKNTNRAKRGDTKQEMRTS